MKVALICCAKQEEKYINEWLEHNYNIGITHIYLCDNNDSDYIINISSVINDKYKSFITVLNYQNQVNVQNRCYINVYEDIKTMYDWICIFDCDEFLYLDTFNNISEYISFIDKDNDIDEIVIPWKLMYSDDYLTTLYYNDAPLKTRFNKELEYVDYSHTQSKVIFKSNNVDNVRTHYIVTKSEYTKKSVNSIGEIINYNNTSGIDVNYNINIYLKHYHKKSFEEYLTNKIFRTRAQAGVENYYYIRQPKETNILNFLINSYGCNENRFKFSSRNIDNIYLKLYDEYFNKCLPFIKTNYYNDDKSDITLNQINIDNFNDDDDFINIILYNYVENFRDYIRIYLSKNMVKYINMGKRINITLSDKIYNITIKENKYLYLNNDCYSLIYNDNQLSIISNKKIL